MLPYLCKSDKDGNLTLFSVFLDGRMYGFERSASFFNEIMQAIQNDDIATVRKYVQVKKTIAEFSNGAFQLTENSLFYNGTEIDNSLVKRILELFKLKINVEPMVKFLQNLLQNPSKPAINELYGFMEVCTLPITDDGHFLAYKMIKNDYRDKYTGAMDNSVGATVTMARNLVNDNRNETCSRGLHFCSLEYVEKGCYGSGVNGSDRLVVLKINPRDVVSIPTDYNNSKGRACEYTVLREIEWTDRLTEFFESTSKPLTDSNDFMNLDDGFDSESVDDCNDCGEHIDDCICDVEVSVLKPKVKVDTSPVNLTESKVAGIKRDLKDKSLSLTDVAARNGISRRHAARIRDGEVWAWVKAAK